MNDSVLFVMTKPRVWPATTLIGLFMLASCGNDSGPAFPAVDQISTTPDDSAQTDPEPDDPPAARVDEVIDVGLEADFGGLRYHVAQAALGERFGSPQVSVNLELTNLQLEAVSPRFAVSLHSSGEVFERSGAGGAEIAPGATGVDTYQFPVGSNFSFDDAVLFIGDEGSAQASIELSGGAVVSLTPLEVRIDETGTAELVEMRLDQVIIDWHSLALFDESAVVGTSFLTAVVDITLGDLSRTAQDTFELVLPDGETLTPEKAPSTAISADETATGLEVAFIVPDPFAGDYVLRLLNLRRFPADTMVEIPFAVRENDAGDS